MKITTLLRKIAEPIVPTMYQYAGIQLKIHMREEKYDILSGEKAGNRNEPHDDPDVERISNQEKINFLNKQHLRDLLNKIRLT